VLVGEFVDWVESAPAGRRAEAAYALSRAILFAPPESGDRAAMEAAITVLLDTAATDIRHAIADALADSEHAPRHVIAALAADQVAIAARVLSRSPLFIDAELSGFLPAVARSLRVAIATRPVVSSALAAAIAEIGDREVSLALLNNPGATINAATFAALGERCGDDPAVREAMLARPDLPPAVHQGLVKRLADALGTMVVAKSWVSEGRAALTTREATERATVAIAAAAEPAALPALVEHLRASGQLTTALILRAACAGYLDFFEMALAALAGVPVNRVANLVRAGRSGSLRAIYARAGLPPLAFDAFAAAVETWGRIADEGQTTDYYQSTAAVAEAILARYAPIADGEGSEVATMLRRFAAEQAREAAHEYARLSAA
jgi:uncharacterized protein (DUF2336 family)